MGVSPEVVMRAVLESRGEGSKAAPIYFQRKAAILLFAVHAL